MTRYAITFQKYFSVSSVAFWPTRQCVMDNQSLVIIGATLVTFPLSMLTYYGNLLPYLASYFQAHRDSMTMYLDPLWPSTAFRCCLPVSMMFTTPLERWLGARTCISVGVAVLCVCVLSGFFSVDKPVALTIIFGALHGLSVGLIYPLTSKLLLDTVSGPGGLASGIMSIGPALGSLVNIGLAYAVVNPTNKKADLEKGKTFYFSDPEIIKNVPYYFLVTGAVTAFTTVLGTVLLITGSGRTNTKSEKDRTAELRETFDGKKYGSCSQRENSNIRCNCTLGSNIGKGKIILSDPERSTLRPDEKVCTHKENCSDGCSKHKNIESPPHATKTKVEASVLNIEGTVYVANSDSPNSLQKGCTDTFPTVRNINRSENTKTEKDFFRNTGTHSQPDSGMAQLESTSHPQCLASKDPSNTKNIKTRTAFSVRCDMSPMETLRTRTFWCIWLCYLGLGHTLYVHVNLYKQYGQLVISSDIILVVTGLLSTAFMVVTRPMSGAFSDRFGVPCSLVAVCATSSVFMSIMVCGVHMSSLLYVVAAVAEFSCVSTLITVFNLLVAELFGKSYYGSNMGLVYSAQLANVLLEPFIVSWMVERLGWDWVFLSGSASSAVAMVVGMAL
ncbi:oxalate:formate antiporter [Plakobranchus ocellatus]|uniref:Oxalate:formate antiporter n=1 Tax=Plakobranchus ocellatus TaxID=259542 RepID=A0AAV4A2R0_9GAST|nr:oxalate:formate antiporter [Plakobranchus ocellatus]